jgi:site-specific DNA recombinase
MTLALDTKKLERIVSFYERVSSEDQRERETIKTQQDELAGRLKNDSSVSFFRRYTDDGIKGAIPVAERPAGSQLLKDAEKGLFNELWIYNLKRLGRDKIELLLLQRRFERLRIKIISLQEGELTGIGFDISAVLADYDKKYWLGLSADGMNRAAKEGRYTGGIVPQGYKVVGQKQNAHFELSEEPVWGNLSEAGIVRRIYDHLAVDGLTCVKIANEFNELAIPTDYVLDNREVEIKGQRKKRTQGVWRPGHIRNMVVNPVYKGVRLFGRRTTKFGGRETIAASVPAIVSEDIWNAAQETLHRNRLVGPWTGHIYLLKSVIKCGHCGLTYVSCMNRDSVWYRCNGHLTGRGPMEGRCKSKDIKGDYLEPVVWSDIENFLRDPGSDLLKDITKEREGDTSSLIQETEKTTLEKAKEQLIHRRKIAIDLRTRGRITDEELDPLLDEITKAQNKVEKRLKALQPEPEEKQPEPLDEDLLNELRKRLDTGLTPEQRQEIVRLLVKRITIYTEGEGNNRRARATIEYRFTKPSLVAVQTRNGRDSSPRRA